MSEQLTIGFAESKMHYARLDKSPRLQAVLEYLKGGPRTTLDIIENVRDPRICAVNSVISELRANGLNIRCKELRKGVYEYQLV